MADVAQDPKSSKMAAWTGIAASIVTLLLTVYNAYAKGQIDASEVRLKAQSQKVDDQLRERAADLDASKDRTSRYAFVKTLLPDLVSKDPAQRSLTVNLIRLTLTDAEAAKLFNGIALSDDKSLQAAGTEAITAIRQETSRAQAASDKERQGFQFLVKGDYAASIEGFEAAEKAYPGFHNANEIAGLLKSRQTQLADPKSRKDVFRSILDNYSWKAPADVVEQLRKASQE
jgi:hypothetical protein